MNGGRENAPENVLRKLSWNDGGSLAAEEGSFHCSFELLRSLITGVFGEHAQSGVSTDAAHFAFVQSRQISENIVRSGGQKNLVARSEEGIEAWPVIGDKTSSTSGSFEQPNRRGVARHHHIAPGNVESEA